MEASPEQKRVRWLAISDWGEEGDPLTALAADMERFAARAGPLDLVVSAGDNFYPSGVSGLLETTAEGKTAPFAPDVDSCEFDMWRRTFLRHAHLRVPWRPVLGNHDYMGGQPEAQIAFTHSTRNPEGLWQFPARCYSFRRGPVCFVMFDGCACQWAVRRARPTILQEFAADREWLAQELRKAQVRGGEERREENSKEKKSREKREKREKSKENSKENSKDKTWHTPKSNLTSSLSRTRRLWCW